MLQKSKPIDYLNDPPWKALGSVVFPLLLVYTIQLFTTALTNKISSVFVGTDYFSIHGYLTTALEFFGTIAAGVASSAWILISRYVAAQHTQDVRHHLVTAIYAIALIGLSSIALMVLFSRQILTFVHVPAEIFSKARTYYLLYCISFFPTALASFFLMVLNGTSSAKQLFMINLFTVCNSALLAVLVLVVAKMSLIGAAILPTANAVTRLFLYFTILKKKRLFSFLPIVRANWNQIWKIIKYGAIIALQSLLCSVGYLAVSMQTNKFLSPQYICVLSVSLPIHSVFDALSAAVTAFCPQNYAAGNTQRLKKFLTITALIGFFYGIFCFLVFICIGRWYFGNLFDDPLIIANGAKYWFWQGIGYPFVSLLYTVRFFLDAVGKSKLSLLAGMGELVGNLACAFWLIPVFGNIGRNLSSPLGWFLGSAIMLIAFYRVRKHIFTPQVPMRNKSPQ